MHVRLCTGSMFTVHNQRAFMYNMFSMYKRACVGRRSQDFIGEVARLWVTAPKGVRGVIPGKNLKTYMRFCALYGIRCINKLISFFFCLFFPFLLFRFSLSLSSFFSGGGPGPPAPPLCVGNRHSVHESVFVGNMFSVHRRACTGDVYIVYQRATATG